jgi:hypothetical protein
MRSFTVAVASISIMLLGTASAQTITDSQMRAANMARMQAELLNGGIGKYSPANCMHQGGGGSCMVSNSIDGYLFRFFGGSPGWDAMGKSATLETEVLVSPDGRNLFVEYNGPIRER